MVNHLGKVTEPLRLEKRPPLTENLTRCQKRVIAFLRAARQDAKDRGISHPKCLWTEGALMTDKDSPLFPNNIRCKLATIEWLYRCGYVSVNPLSGGLVEVWEIPHNWAYESTAVRRREILYFYNTLGAIKAAPRLTWVSN